MKQRIVYLCCEHADDLAIDIQQRIDERNKYGYYLADIKYFGLEEEHLSFPSAFLLFNEFKKCQKDCCHEGS